MDQEIKNEFVKINKKMDQKFDLIDQKFDKVDQKFDMMDKKFDGLNENFKNLGIEFEDFRHDLKFVVETLDAAVNLPPTKEDQRSINENHEMRIKVLETRVKDF